MTEVLVGQALFENFHLNETKDASLTGKAIEVEEMKDMLYFYSKWPYIFL